ncbi:MAG TPA: hypothetical protein VFE62_18120, partial [Gemmataceae bacterium]|nr:hypothetical protein [Gemmataceae bacterium]
ALELHAEGSVPNAEAANKLVKKIADLRKQGIGELQKAMQQPLPAGAPPVPFQAMINVLDTIQVQSQQEKVSVRVSAPNTLLQQLPMLFLMGRGAILD